MERNMVIAILASDILVQNGYTQCKGNPQQQFFFFVTWFYRVWLEHYQMFWKQFLDFTSCSTTASSDHHSRKWTKWVAHRFSRFALSYLFRLIYIWSQRHAPLSAHPGLGARLRWWGAWLESSYISYIFQYLPMTYSMLDLLSLDEKTLSFAKKATNFQFWMEIDLQKTPSSRPSWPKIFLGRSVCWSSSSWKVPTPETSGWCRTTPFCDQQKRRRLEIQEVKNGGSSGFFSGLQLFGVFFWIAMIWHTPIEWKPWCSIGGHLVGLLSLVSQEMEACWIQQPI